MRVKWKRVAGVAFGFWLIYSWPTESLSPVEVSVTPRAAIGPTDLRIRVLIERHDDNLWLYIDWKSERLDGNSEIRLDGTSPCEFIREIPQAPPGKYHIYAVVFRISTRGRRTEFTSATTADVH